MPTKFKKDGLEWVGGGGLPIAGEARLDGGCLGVEKRVG